MQQQTFASSRRLVLALITTLIVVASCLALGLYAYRQHMVHQQEQAEKAALAEAIAEEKHAQALQEEFDREAAERARQQQAAAAEAAANKKIVDRCEAAQAMSLYMAYKSGSGQKIRAVDSGVDTVPESETELDRLPAGDCRLAIFLFEAPIAAQMAEVFEEKTGGMQKIVVDGGFSKVVFADPGSVCHASVAPEPFGLGEITCHQR